MVFLFGAGDEARTRYLDLGKVALYQMSYARKRKVNCSRKHVACQPCIFIFCKMWRLLLSAKELISSDALIFYAETEARQ